MVSPKRARSASVSTNGKISATTHTRALSSPPRKSSSANGTPTKPNYQSGSPIKFYDEEVTRMHTELEKRDKAQKTSRRTSSRPSKPSGGITVKGFFARVAVFYLLLAIFLVCPNDPSRERAVCRGLDTTYAKLKAYEPLARPYYRAVQTRLDPYIAQAHLHVDPYVARVRPHYLRVDSFIRPYAVKGLEAYRNEVYPRLVKGVTASQKATKPYMEVLRKNYHATLAPSVEWYSRAFQQWYAKHLAPHVRLVSDKTTLYTQNVYDVVAPVYYTGVPLASKHYHATVLPFARSSFKTSRKIYVEQVHPRALVAGGHLHVFYRTKVLPALQRFYSLYIAPQVDKITEKIFEYRTKKEHAEAVASVAAAEAILAKENDVKQLDTFISEDRDIKYTGESVEETPTEEHVLTPEELKAKTAAKRAALESLQATYEKEIAKLGATEQVLLVQRLADIRSGAVDDIPKRFGATLTALDEEGDRMIGRLGKYFSKVASDEKTSVQEKVDDAEFIATTGLAKVRELANAALAEAAEYQTRLQTKEANAVERASHALSALVKKAQEELSFGWTWLDDVKNSDWQRFHQLAKAEGNWRQYYSGIQSGEIAEDDLAKADPVALLDDVCKEIDDTVLAFEKVFLAIKVKGQKELKGEWTGISNEAQKVFDAAGNRLADVVGAVKSSASSFAGVTPTPTNFQESASSYASVAQESASSFASSAYNALPTVPAVPTDYLVDSFDAVTSNVGSVVDQAASAVDDAAHAVVTAVPEALASVISMASSLGDVVGIQAAETASKLGAGISSLAAPHPAFTASPPLQSRLSSVLADGAVSASSLYGDASQAVLRAAGEEPSPTDLHQSATSLAHAAASVAAAVKGKVDEYAAPHPAFETKDPAEPGFAASLTEQVKSAASSLAAHVEL